MAQRPITINGRTWDFTSIRITGFPGGAPSMVPYLRDITYSDIVSPEATVGVHGIPLPRGRGTYTTSSSLTLVREGWDLLVESADFPDGYSQYIFDLLIEFQGAKRKTVRHELKETSIIAVNDNYQRGGTDGLMCQLTLSTRYILRSGKCIYPLDLPQVLNAAGDAAGAAAAAAARGAFPGALVGI